MATLGFAVSGAQAGGENASAMRATSVAEMMQSRQEAQLREQLAQQGRWDEVREIDQAQAQRLAAHKKQTLTKFNGQLAAVTPVDSPALDSMGTLCAPMRAATPISTKIFATGPAADQPSMRVR